MPAASNVTQLIGNTPLVKLHRVVLENSATVLVKLSQETLAGRSRTVSVWRWFRRRKKRAIARRRYYRRTYLG